MRRCLRFRQDLSSTFNNVSCYMMANLSLTRIVLLDICRHGRAWYQANQVNCHDGWRCFQKLDMLGTYEKLKKKYPPPKWEYHYIKGKQVVIHLSSMRMQMLVLMVVMRKITWTCLKQPTRSETDLTIVLYYPLVSFIIYTFIWCVCDYV